MGHLESDKSQAKITSAAQHEDELSPAKIVRDRTTEAPGQRIGDNAAVANPVTSMPEDDAEDRNADDVKAQRRE